ncbi:hypothetical protein GQR58_011098 [Nymphon striatum]|nr:hypothetical protein GQR58_011098 [Nymphon striatum]
MNLGNATENVTVFEIIENITSTILIPTNTSAIANDTGTNGTEDIDRGVVATHELSTSNVLTYAFIFFGVIAIIAVLVVAGIFIIKKSRLDKLRHHLMPLYNFDPAEEGEDWESELLEEGLDHRLTSKMKKSYCTEEPKLAFNSGI